MSSLSHSSSASASVLGEKGNVVLAFVHSALFHFPFLHSRMKENKRRRKEEGPG